MLIRAGIGFACVIPPRVEDVFFLLDAPPCLGIGCLYLYLGPKA